jgi:membrane protease YdiL (CAAX protease family)
MTTNMDVGPLPVYNRIEEAGWREPLRKIGLFVLFLAISIAVFILGSNYYQIYPTNHNITYEAWVSAVLLIAALVLRRQARFRRYGEVIYAFFIASAVITVTTLVIEPRDALFRALHLLTGDAKFTAISKVFEVTVTITTILVLAKLGGLSLDSLYVKRGNLKWGLLLGIGVLVNFASSALMFFYSRYPNQEALGNAIVWGMVFSLVNGFMEELWLRGLFLRRLAPLLGIGAAVTLTALWFALFHAAAFYFQPQAIPLFLINVFTFALAWGYSMHKTDSWIAPGLMHAASDFFLFMAVLS